MIDKRTVGTGIAVALASLGLASCAGGASGAPSSTADAPPTSTTRPVPARSYLAEGANDVDWVQLTAGDRPTGIVEELLGPAVAPGGTTADWVYRLSGSVTGRVLTYTVTPISSGAAPAPGPFTGTVTAHSITIGRPLTQGAGTVLTAATQHEYDLAARYHATTWKRTSG